MSHERAHPGGPPTLPALHLGVAARQLLAQVPIPDVPGPRTADMKIIAIDGYDQAMAEILSEIKRQAEQQQDTNRRRTRRKARRRRKLNQAGII